MRRPDPIDRALARASWAALAIALGVALAMVLQTLARQS